MLIAASAAALWVSSALRGALALPTWPSSIDELEDIMFLNTGYRARAFSAGVTPCSFSQHGPSRIASAEWIRTAFHDAATGNVFTGRGGLDASIVYELGGNGGENKGEGFNTTLETFVPFFSTRASMADLIAIGVYTAVRSCGGPIVPIRAGRIDATGPGPIGVPQPENSQGTFINQFARIGFSVEEMIAVTACGHTLGGVHAGNFPQILAPGTVENDFQLFDETTSFDEKVARDFIDGKNINPLTGALARQNTRDSDTKVYTADGNVTITALADPATFHSTCATVLQKMIEVVPSTVTLTDPIEPYEIKPSNLQLSLNGNGSTIGFSGEIRVRTTSRPASEITSVRLLFRDRDGGSNCGSCVISTQLKGEASGFDDTFAFYGFSVDLPIDTSISSFNVEIALSSEDVEIYDNNGSGYRVQDTIMFQPEQSCMNGDLTVVAAVRDVSASSTVTLSLTMKTPRNCCVVPALTKQLVTMTAQDTIGPYTFYSGTYPLDPSQSTTTRFDVLVTDEQESVSDSFKSTADLGSTCKPFGDGGPSSPNIDYRGCYTDSVFSRALTGAASDDDEMTIDFCADFCQAYRFFGLEYGRECFCGNTQSSESTLVADSECSMPCGGDGSKICGASNRLSVYENLDWIPTVNPEIEGYEYLGCYNDSTARRGLSDTFVYDSEMTVELCAEFCSGANYFGVEYFSECYCGAELSDSSTVQPEADCSFFCSGNSTQYCGGSNRMNVYVKEGLLIPEK
ncbi:hypothetical protein VTO42DRAFT_8183 [Malbranchea cinnamomea]